MWLGINRLNYSLAFSYSMLGFVRGKNMENTQKLLYSQKIKEFTSKLVVNNNYLPLNPPKISIVTVSFNQAEFLERMILSVINQGYENVEHIVIDGGSTDGSVDILKKYDSYISFWCSESDRGQTHGINKGLALATGDLVAFQNSDDVYLDGTFYSVAKSFRANDDVDLVYGNFLHINQDDDVLDESLLGTAWLWVQLFLGPQVHNQSAFWNINLFKEIGYLDESYDFCMDYEFFSRIMNTNPKIIFLSQYLGAFRHHGNSKTSNLQDVSKRELAAVSNLYISKNRFLSLMPKKIMCKIAKIVKASKHILDGRADYIFRRRFNFKG